MPLQATSGAASYDAFGGGAAAVPQYIEDVFSTYLWTGNGTSQTITNGIDLSGKGGMLWIKSRSDAYGHRIVDSQRTPFNTLNSASTSAEEATLLTAVSAFNSNGFTLANSAGTNGSGSTYVSWAFRKQPKFFDVVTYTGTFSNLAVNHNLGSVPGMIIVKSVTGPSIWSVYHRSLGATKYLRLNQTTGETTSSTPWNNTAPTSTQFTVGSDYDTNDSDVTYVAYLFAHDAGGFGLTGTDNVISCGSISVDASGKGSANLGWEPQWVLIKDITNAQSWQLFDSMRGFYNAFESGPLSIKVSPNNSATEAAFGQVGPTATGWGTVAGQLNASSTYIYIAIRRGPMKVPTSGTSVYNAITRTGTGAVAQVTGVGFTPDNVLVGTRSNATDKQWQDRLRGPTIDLATNRDYGEITHGDSLTSFNMDGCTLGADTSANTWNISGRTYVNWFFKRAPSFFDEVCYTGTGAARSVTHNLAAVPEMMIVKVRDSATDWAVYHSGIGATKRLILNLTDTPYTSATAGWNDTAPTASVFTVGTNVNVNGNGYVYVAYLFATCAGVSKVFSYTGNGSSQTINCGFTGGARFVLIKRTDSTGDWYVWDSVRGIVSGNDPHLSLNTTAAEVTTDDSVDTDSTGFVVNQDSATNVNVSSSTYIGIAIA